MDPEVIVLEKTENFIFEKMRETNLPSVSISIVKGGKLVYSRAFGYSNAEKGEKATADTLYGIGSISKSFTCLSIMKLQEMGKLSVEDEVNKYVPLNLPGVKIHHLMSHTSGIPGLGYAENLIREQVLGKGKHLPVADVDDLLTFMKNVKNWHLFEPGSRWFYLNEGYEILERIVEKASGKSFKDFVREEIFEPLELNCAFLEDFDDRFAQPYYPSGDLFKRGRVPSGPMNGAGGIACSSEDLARYGYMYASRNEKVVSKDSILEMEKVRVKIPLKIPYGDYGYGYGLMVMSDFHGRKIVGHGGSVLVYTASLIYSPEDDVSIAVLSNSTGYVMRNFTLHALAEIVGIDVEELEFVKREKALLSLEGKYRTYMGTIEASVEKRGDFLVLKLFEDATPTEVILVPEELSDERSVFFTISNGSRLHVDFVKRNGKTLLIYERYVFEKE